MQSMTALVSGDRLKLNFQKQPETQILALFNIHFQ